MSFWACRQRISFTTKVVVNAERVTALCHQESFLIQVCNRLGPNTSKLTTGLSSPSRGILPVTDGLLKDTSQPSFFHKHILALGDTQKINKAAKSQKAQTQDKSEA